MRRCCTLIPLIFGLCAALCCGNVNEERIAKLETKLKADPKNRQALTELSFLYCSVDYEATYRAETMLKTRLGKKGSDTLLNLLLGIVYVSRGFFEKNRIKGLMWLKVASGYFDRAAFAGRNSVEITSIVLYYNAIILPQLARFRFVEDGYLLADTLLRKGRKKMPDDRYRKLRDFIRYSRSMGKAAKDCAEGREQMHFKNSWNFARTRFFNTDDEKWSYFMKLLKREMRI